MSSTRDRLEELLCKIAPGELDRAQEEAEGEILELFDRLAGEGSRRTLTDADLDAIRELSGCQMGAPGETGDSRARELLEELVEQNSPRLRVHPTEKIGRCAYCHNRHTAPGREHCADDCPYRRAREYLRGDGRE